MAPGKQRRQSGRAGANAEITLTVTIPGLLDSGDDTDFREMISLMYAAVGRLTTMRRTLAELLGLSSAQFAVAMTLFRRGAGRGAKIRDIAHDLYVSAANITVTVGQLESIGWVVKAGDPEDSRAVAINLTDDARRRLDVFSGRLHAVNDVWFRKTSRSELLAVISFFRQLVERYEPALNAAKDLNQGIASDDGDATSRGSNAHVGRR